jgi:hypothetical protein
MSCPYSDEELQEWDGVTNPMGAPCYSCEDWDCEHNENEDHPERIPFDEDESMIHHSSASEPVPERCEFPEDCRRPADCPETRIARQQEREKALDAIQEWIRGNSETIEADDGTLEDAVFLGELLAKLESLRGGEA